MEKLDLNRKTGSGPQNFKQIEGDSWSSIYLPAIGAGVVMTVVLFLAIACSKKSETAQNKISAPAQPALSAPAPVSTSAVAAPVTPKKVKKARPVNATYVNGTYGVSFSYPRKYSLAAGNSKSVSPVPAGFVKPGAIQIASVDLPDSSYADTDFSSALLNVSVHTAMTEEECAQFGSNTKDSEAAKPSVVKLGANEFSATEQMNGEMTHQSDLKYYHLFKNGACYEFALDVETSRKADEELAQVDRGQVFKQLQKMLATARIKDVELTGVKKEETAASTLPVGDSKPADVKANDSKPADSTVGDAKAATASSSSDTTTVKSSTTDSSTEKAQVVTPEQK